MTSIPAVEGELLIRISVAGDKAQLVSALNAVVDKLYSAIDNALDPYLVSEGIECSNWEILLMEGAGSPTTIDLQDEDDDIGDEDEDEE